MLFEQFSYDAIQSRFNTMRWLLNEHFRNLYPELITLYKQAEERFRSEILNISEQFRAQLQRLLSKSENPEEDVFLQERIQKAAVYFAEKTNLIFQDLLDNSIIETDNKEVRKRVNDVLGFFQTEVRLKRQTLEVCKAGFKVPAYMDAKSKSLIEEEEPKQKKKKKTSKDPQAKIVVPKDILHPELYEQLRSWRYRQAQEQNVPAYVVLSQMALMGITNLLPLDSTQLLQIPGIGKTTLDRYGEDMLQIVQENVQRYGYEVKEHVIVYEIVQEKKESKSSTQEQSFLLLQQGMSIGEIAKERSLAASTIETHLLPYVKSGAITLEKLVAPEKIDKIKEILQQNPETTGLSEIKTILGDDYSYSEIRFVKACGDKKE
jgi:DNA-binding CsgD family transcriptional regulator